MQKVIMMSGKAQSGKDTAYELIQPHMYKFKYPNPVKRIGFADALKESAKKDFGWDGVKDDTGRKFLIDFGQLMRNESIELQSFYKVAHEKIVCREDLKRYANDKGANPNYWADIVSNIVSEDSETDYIITDFRFKNEYEVMKESRCGRNPLYSIRIQRDSELSIDDRSETELDDFKHFDYYISNNGTKDEYQEKLGIFVDFIFGATDNMNHLIYISGQMTGIENYNRKNFFDVNEMLMKKAFNVLNPFIVGAKFKKDFGLNEDEISWKNFLKEDLKLLLNCDMMYMLKGWENSKGALLEHKVAKECGLDIIYE